MNLSKSAVSVLLVAALAFPVLLAFGPTAYASDVTTSTAANPSATASGIEAALSACAAAVAKDDHERPERKAIDACMQAKGFTPPQGRPGQSGNPPPPPSN